MKLKYFQKGFNYSQDGRGNRLIFHLQGCNMKCPWCANPEGMPVKGVLMTDKDWLKESCCPRGAVYNNILDRTVCENCEDRPCTAKRRQKGIRLSYKETDIEEILSECVSSVPMFFDGGGVTFTGGEATLQFDALKELLTRLGEKGIHRAIETNGTHPKAAELIGLVDEWITDLKHYDNEKHLQWLGVENTRILSNLELVTQTHRDVLIRIPLMPGFNDTKTEAEGLAETLGRIAAKDTVRVEVLPYHEFGKAKWEQCGFSYQMKSARIPEETRLYLEKCLKDAGLHVVRT